jgi:hypothetical protein
MNVDEKALAHKLFQSKVLTSEGQAFEDLFTLVMQKSNPNFVQVKPQGKFGDRGVF